MLPSRSMADNRFAVGAGRHLQALRETSSSLAPFHPLAQHRRLTQESEEASVLGTAIPRSRFRLARAD